MSFFAIYRLENRCTWPNECMESKTIEFESLNWAISIGQLDWKQQFSTCYVEIHICEKINFMSWKRITYMIWNNFWNKKSKKSCNPFWSNYFKTGILLQNGLYKPIRFEVIRLEINFSNIATITFKVFVGVTEYCIYGFTQ